MTWRIVGLIPCWFCLQGRKGICPGEGLLHQVWWCWAPDSSRVSQWANWRPATCLWRACTRRWQMSRPWRRGAGYFGGSDPGTPSTNWSTLPDVALETLKVEGEWPSWIECHACDKGHAASLVKSYSHRDWQSGEPGIWGSGEPFSSVLPRTAAAPWARRPSWRAIGTSSLPEALSGARSSYIGESTSKYGQDSRRASGQSPCRSWRPGIRRQWCRIARGWSSFWDARSYIPVSASSS